MGEYGTREDELDDLLRGEVFVDLYRSSRSGLRRVASRLRAQADRDVLRLRAHAPRSGRRQLDRRVRGLARDARPARSSTRSRPTTRRTASRRSSCATGCSSCAARRWRTFGPIPLPEPRGAEADTASKLERAELRAALLEAGERARGAAPRLPPARGQAGLVGVLRPDRADDRGAASRTPTRSAGSSRTASPEPDKKSLVYRSRSRRRSTSSGRAAAVRPSDRRRRRDDRRARRRGADARAEARPERSTSGRCPRRSFPAGPYDTNAQQDALERLGALVARRRRPLPGARVGAPPRAVRRATCRRPSSTRTELVAALDGSHLVIQGPPGSGKT